MASYAFAGQAFGGRYRRICALRAAITSALDAS